MAAKSENNLPLPPEGGAWRIVFRSGRGIAGVVVGSYDNCLVVELANGQTTIAMKSEIESYWQGYGTEPAPEKKE